MKKSEVKKVVTKFYGEVSVYNKIYKNGTIELVIEGKPFGKLTFDEGYPFDQLLAEDLDQLIESMKI